MKTKGNYITPANRHGSNLSMDATSSLGMGVDDPLLPVLAVLELSFVPLAEGQVSRMQGCRAN